MQILLIHQIEVHTGTSENVPPSMALQNEAIWDSPLSSGCPGQMTEVDVHIPQEVTKEKDEHAEKHDTVQLLEGQPIVNVGIGQSSTLDNDSCVEHGVSCLVDGWILEFQIDGGEKICCGENQYTHNDRAFGRPELRENTPERDACGVYHGEFV